mgnify:CR=1 FL=1
MAVETVSSLLFTGPLTWTGEAACAGQTELFFAPAGERPETRLLREARARAICMGCDAVDPCRRWARAQSVSAGEQAASGATPTQTRP